MAAELTESQINGRFKVYDKPQALPGKCAVCGSVERPVVDFGLDVEFYGAVVICVTCVTEAASILDLVPASDLRTARLVQQRHQDQINEAGEVASEYAARLTDLLGEFTTHLRGIYDPAGVVDEQGTQDSNGGTEPPAGKDVDLTIGERPAKLSASRSDGDDVFSL